MSEWRRQHQSLWRADVCYTCEQPIPAGAPIYRTRDWGRVYVECVACGVKSRHSEESLGPLLTLPCDQCGRPVTQRPHGSQKHWTCSSLCAQRLTVPPVDHQPAECDQCGELFTPARADARYCTPACRQKAYRARKS